MRNQIRILVATIALAAVWEGSARVPEALASMDTFRVTNVEVLGLHYVTRAEALTLLGLTAESTVWVNTDVLAQRLTDHPLVKSATVQRRMPGTLVIDVVERRPVALVPTPTLEPVDAEGVRLPIDPARHRLDLPILESVDPPAGGGRLLPRRSRRLAAEVGRLLEADTAFQQMVSELSLVGPATLRARWTDPEVDFLLRPDAAARRLHEGFAVLADALGRDPGHPPAIIDLRYADQVVVRRSR